MGTGPYKLDTEPDGFCEGQQVRWVLAAGAAKAGFYHRRPVVDNNTRAAMLQTGEAQFAFPIPYEQAPLLAKTANWSWWPAVDHAALHQHERDAEAVR